jgi:hypothetical protein
MFASTFFWQIISFDPPSRLFTAYFNFLRAHYARTTCTSLSGVKTAVIPVIRRYLSKKKSFVGSNSTRGYYKVFCRSCTFSLPAAAYARSCFEFNSDGLIFLFFWNIQTVSFEFWIPSLNNANSKTFILYDKASNWFSHWLDLFFPPERRKRIRRKVYVAIAVIHEDAKN